MDSKNEDSAGSDSLDKTLQQKCKMDDTSQCGSKVLQSVTAADSLAVTDIVGDGANIRDKAQQASELGQAQSEQLQQHQSQNSSTKPLKTDTYLMGDGINAAATVARETSLRFFKASSTISNTIFSRDDSNSSTSSSSSSCGVSNSSNNNNNNNSSKSSSNNNNNNNNNKSNSSNNKSKNSGSHNIEKKVKQISQNLQETSLQVTQLMPVEEHSNPEPSSSPSSSSTTLLSASTSGAPTSTSSATTLPDNEQQPGPSRSNSASNSESTLALSLSLSLSHSELNTNTLAANDSMEDNGDHRSKKVRFHPDAKENDGGNRIIPKKKKKFKEAPLLKVFSADMEFDENVQEEDDIEEEEGAFDEEEEFDIERTIAEAENYLQLHPIIFVPSMPPQKPLTNLKVPLPSGLMTEEDLEPSDEENQEDDDGDDDDVDDEKEATDEDYMNKNSVECILGKRCINGECSYLLRFVDKSALSWKPEHFINKNWPKLLNTYEKDQQVQQENLMKYVAKRQNLRQRFTDF